jgi:hypothetical protein
MKKKVKKKTKSQRSKVSDENFWKILEANMGLYENTSRMIKKQLGVSYTRAACYIRANKEPERLKQIYEVRIDIAETTLLQNLKSSDQRVSQKAAEFLLKTIGKTRGYYEKSEVKILTGQELDDAVREQLARVAGAGQKSIPE